ncbi:MAG: translation initiation factor IF-2 [Candidatus Melainabacteria bacterium]|nr:MAG: translation initiation factor IF-2 [Candidatus Melainabacteria bacterium]
MNDRVRVYELARQMNLENGDIITALRELGYDIKSHSSTIDASTVGLLISHLGKKNGKGEKDKPAVKTAAKPLGKIPPPQTPEKQKPRVLARYRKETAPEETVAEAPPVDAAPVQEPAEKVAPQEPVAPPAPPEPVVEAAPAPPVVEEVDDQSKAPKGKGDEKPEEVPAQPVKEPVKEAPTEPAAPPKSEEPPKEDKSKATENFSPDAFKKLVQSPSVPTVPSQPVRVAAPSNRATPPRPPKSRHAGHERQQQQKKEEKSRPAAATIEVPKVITLTQNLTVKELAEKMNVADTEVIKRLFMKGTMRTVNQLVEVDLARELASEMEYEVLTEEKVEEVVKVEEDLSEEDLKALVTRPPVVTIMGHVDHGKTSLLDAIRQTKFLLTDAEHGGITQHIGAYHVEVPHEDGSLRQIVFLDTPGHEAFTAMRARGAKATDVAILVVAADDGVMPQTIEAIDHVKAAGVPIIVAVNKIDKQDADPDRVLTQLMEHGILPDKFGGDTVTVNVSAKKRTGLDELLEMILLVSEIQDLKANPEKPANGVIIEAELSRGKGAVATALVQTGTLREGDLLIAGTASGRVRALFDDRGQRVKAAGPSMPVEVLGLDDVPQAGDRFEVVADMQIQKQIVDARKAERGDRRPHHVTLESLHDMLATGEVKELNIIVKADVQGTAEAIAEQIRKLTSNEVAVRVLRTSSGDISENDVNLAASSNAIIVGFNVQPDRNAQEVSEKEGVDVRTYNIIYQITDDLEKAIQGLIQPLKSEVQIGQAEIRAVFKLGKALSIGGCMVTSGKVKRGGIAKIDRDGTIVYEGKIETLKRFKDDAKEVATGFECGMSFEKFNDLQEGDKVNVYEIQETKREITRS